MARSGDLHATRRLPHAASCLAMLAGVAVLLAACSGAATSDAEPATEYVLVFQVTDDRREFVERTEPLAAWISEQTRTPTRVLTVQEDRAQITALATGQAHAGYLSGGPAWVGWQEFDLDVIAAEVRAEDGRTSYVAGLWVLADSGLTTVADLEGRDSCHTGELAGTGMLVPMGYLIRHGHVDTSDVDLEDIAALPQLRERFFGESQIGGGYAGALRCLSTGAGEVATGRDTAVDDFCRDDPEPWCRPPDEYRFLPAADGAEPVEPEGGFARVPSHPVMVSPHLHEDDVQALRDAFLALNDDPEGRRIAEDVLGVAGLEPTDAASHLGPYGELLDQIPGIRDHLLDPEDPS